jgi:hypothetical protein
MNGVHANTSGSLNQAGSNPHTQSSVHAPVHSTIKHAIGSSVLHEQRDGFRAPPPYLRKKDVELAENAENAGVKWYDDDDDESESDSHDDEDDDRDAHMNSADEDPNARDTPCGTTKHKATLVDISEEVTEQITTKHSEALISANLHPQSRSAQHDSKDLSQAKRRKRKENIEELAVANISRIPVIQEHFNVHEVIGSGTHIHARISPDGYNVPIVAAVSYLLVPINLDSIDAYANSQWLLI